MMMGVWGLVGSLNCDLRMKTGTVGGSPPSSGRFSASHVVATPLLRRPVGVSYWTSTAVMWTVVG